MTLRLNGCGSAQPVTISFFLFFCLHIASTQSIPPFISYLPVAHTRLPSSPSLLVRLGWLVFPPLATRPFYRTCTSAAPACMKLFHLLLLHRLLLLLASSAATAAAQHATRTRTHTTSDFYSLKPRLLTHQRSAHSTPAFLSLSSPSAHQPNVQYQQHSKYHLRYQLSTVPSRPLRTLSHAMLSLRLVCLFHLCSFKPGCGRSRTAIMQAAKVHGSSLVHCNDMKSNHQREGGTGRPLVVCEQRRLDTENPSLRSIGERAALLSEQSAAVALFAWLKTLSLDLTPSFQRFDRATAPSH